MGEDGQPLPGAGTRRAARPPRWRRRAVTILGLLVGVVGGLWMSAYRAMGGRPSGARLERVRRSPQHDGERFVNQLPMEQGPFLEMLGKWLAGGSPHRSPQAAVSTTDPRGVLGTAPATGLRVTWLGHSTLLIEVDGRRFLTDPVFSERAAPWSWMGPKRFFAPPLALDELPELDAVVISHDHYDHLDMAAIEALSDRVPRFVVPLGVGAHLARWDVPEEKVEEFDWWEEARVGDVRLVCTPARHFSGRGVFDKDRTLWASWAFVGPEHRVYFSGDTGMHPEFAEIGARLGPFDLTLIEVGAYDPLWPDVHLGPEQALEAHALVRGRVLLPVHWGTFDLALHGWTEPIERLLASAADAGVTVATPAPGGSVEPELPIEVVRWWPELEWRPAEEVQVRSTHLPATILPSVPMR